MTRVGLIGCGVVGQRLGAKLLRAGFELQVYDKHPERTADLVALGAAEASAPAALGASCDAVVSALPDADSVFAALAGPDGVWSDARRSLIHVDTSTIGPACARRLASEASVRRVRYLDAPLSAGPVGETGPTLTLFVSGNADHFDIARPLLDAIAEQVHFVGGPPGMGQVVKLVNNVTSHALTVVLGDALALGVAAGVPVEMLRAALHDGTAQCRLLDELLPASAMRGDWRPGLRLDLALKDLALAAELAGERGVEGTLIPEIRAAYERARGRGWGSLGSHAVLRLVEERAGVSFRSPFFTGEDRSPRAGSRDDFEPGP